MGLGFSLNDDNMGDDAAVISHAGGPETYWNVEFDNSLQGSLQQTVPSPNSIRVSILQFSAIAVTAGKNHTLLMQFALQYRVTHQVGNKVGLT